MTVKTHSDRSDEDLLLAARRREKGAFDAIVARYEKRLLKVAYGALLNWHDAQDAAQKALIGLFTRMSSLNVSNDGAVGSYLYRSVTNASIDIIRTHIRKPAGPLREHEALALDSPTKSQIVKEERSILLDCIAELAPKSRLVIVLRFIGALTEDEVVGFLTRLNWGRAEAEAMGRCDDRKIADIAEHTKSRGVGTVGGVGNILKKAKAALRKCFDRKTAHREDES